MRKRQSERMVGRKPSEETRMKMSKSRLGIKINCESIRKMVNSRMLDGSYVMKHETKLKLSESHKGLLDGAKNPAARKILAFNRQNEFLGEFSTARDAALALNIGDNWKHIPAVCRGKRKHTNGYVFKYSDNLPEQKDILALDPLLIDIPESDDCGCDGECGEC
jgi:hypothetical protein